MSELKLQAMKKIDLTGVPQTLLLPLIGRAMYSQKSYSPVKDEQAQALVQSIDYDFDKLLHVRSVKQSLLFWIARAYHFDQAIKQFLQEEPDGVIVSLGCGLDTSFKRVDNGQLAWINMDLPEVIELRNTLLLSDPRETNLAKSLLEYSWMEDIKAYQRKPFFFAGGLLMYFTEAEVKSLLVKMAQAFPNAYFIFDNISPRGLTRANKMLTQSNMKNALLQWAIEDATRMTSWHESIKVIEQHGYFTGIKDRFAFPWSSKLTMYLFDFFHQSGIIKLQL